MRVADFSFDLPEELIARYPKPDRTSSRLMSVEGNSGEILDIGFTDIVEQLNTGDLLIFNNTRVIPARMFGQKESGGKIEVLVERIIDDKRFLAHVRASKALKVGNQITLEDKVSATMLGRHGALFEIEIQDEQSVLSMLEEIGHMPLPPYIDRPDEDSDRERYQTVYNEKPGAVAAPTAGLHFDENLLEQIKAKGVELAFITLHVGAGTFQPVKVDEIADHIMHSEYVEVSENVVQPPPPPPTPPPTPPTPPPPKLGRKPRMTLSIFVRAGKSFHTIACRLLLQVAGRNLLKACRLSRLSSN